MGIEEGRRHSSNTSDLRQIEEPVSIVLGTVQKWKGYGENRAYKIIDETMMYVPLPQTIQTLLEDPIIYNEVNKSQADTGRVIASFCDGQMFKKNALFNQYPFALQINLYYDDVEICNPLGSKRKIHKLGFFYFLLNNVPPTMRSQTNRIQLVAIVKRKLIAKYSMKMILQPIFDDIKKLENGIEIVLNGRKTMVHGTIATICADNLGSCAIGGFKEGSTAYRFCRQCYTKYEDVKLIAHEDMCALRTKELHDKECKEAEEAANKSVQYGINSKCIFNDLKYFHTSTGVLLPDIMHDVLEGGLQYEAKLMLKQFVYEDKYFTSADLSYRLENYGFGYMDSKNRPTPITSKILKNDDNSLCQNASQMWLLARSLPLIIGSFVPSDDQYWENFCTFLTITRILFAPRLTEDDLAILQESIMDHHQKFVALYPSNSVIPKLHYLIHTPRLIHKFGPLVHQWTMRYEAKHRYFKILANTIGNFINAPYTLAMRHQYLQCYLHQDNEPTCHPEFTKGINMTASELPYLTDLIQSGSDVLSTNSVKVNGITYKVQAVVATKPAIGFGEPLFGQIREIYIVNTSVYFYIQALETVYNDHYCTFVASSTLTFDLVMLQSIASYLPLSPNSLSAFPGHFCLTPKFIIR